MGKGLEEALAVPDRPDIARGKLFPNSLARDQLLNQETHGGLEEVGGSVGRRETRRLE